MGDGGANADSVSQWCTGSALAEQVNDLRSAGAGGLGALPLWLPVRRSDESGPCRRRTCRSDGIGRAKAEPDPL